MSPNEHKHVTGLTVLPQQKCHKKWTKLQSLLCCLHFFFVAFLCRYLCSFFLSFCVYNFVVRLHVFEVVLYRFCISLWLFFFTFLKRTFLCLWVFCASFANHCEFLDSLQPLCNNSFFLSFSLLLFCLFCLFSVHLQSFLIILWYLWSIFM